MNCNSCGREITDNAKFCPWCGAAQTAEETPFSADTQEENVFRETEQATPEEEDFVQTSSKKQEQQPAVNGYNGMAIAGFVLAFFFPLLGLIFSAIGIAQCNSREQDGKGLAIAGLVLSIVLMVVVIIVIASTACFTYHYYRW